MLRPYAKITLYESLVESSVPDALEFTPDGPTIFPGRSASASPDQMYEHCLAANHRHPSPTRSSTGWHHLRLPLGEETGATCRRCRLWLGRSQRKSSAPRLTGAWGSRRGQPEISRRNCSCKTEFRKPIERAGDSAQHPRPADHSERT